MTWQKRARLGIALFVVLFIVFLGAALRHRRPAPGASNSPRTDKNAIVETHERSIYERKNKEGKTVVAIESQGQRVYADGRTVLEGVKLMLPDKGGRAITVTAKHAEIVTPATPGQQIGVAKLTGSVHMVTSDGMDVTTNEATYDEGRNLVDVPGPMQFTRGRMTGSSSGANYDQKADVLTLLEQAHVVQTPDKKGGGALTATSKTATVARAEHYVRLAGEAHIVAEGRTIQGDTVTAYLTSDDEHVQKLEVRENSRITGSGSGGPQTMSARNIDLMYAQDGRTLQHAVLMLNAVVQLPGEGRGPGRRISATNMEIAMAPDGSTVTNLNATENVQVDLPADGDQPARRIRSTVLMSVGAPNTGLQTATFTDKVEFRENRAARRNLPALNRTARSDRLTIETQPGLGALEQADFHANVHFTDGTDTTADAPRALYHVDRDQIDLSPGEAGEPGKAPNVNDGKVSIEARNIQFVLGTQKLKADTRVRSWMQPEKQPDKKTAGTSGTQAPKPATAAKSQSAQSGSKVPSMLNQDEQVNVTSNRLEYDGSASLATYGGNAKLWQGETTIKADTIVLDNKSGNLKANTGVTTVMLLDDVDPKTNQKKQARTTATADTLVYEDATRLATYRGNPAAKAHIVGPQGDLTGDVIQLYLKADANELERAEADGGVTVVDSARNAKGTHLTYTEKDDKYVMTGTPVEVLENTPPQCKKTIGATVTFTRSVDKTTVDGNGVYGMQSTPIACPAGRP